MGRATVHIYGKNYTFVSDKSADFIRKVASYVDDEINEVAEKLQNPAKDDIFILACNNIAEKLLTSEAVDYEDELAKMKKITDSLEQQNASLKLQNEQKNVQIKSLKMSDLDSMDAAAKLEKEKEQNEKTVKKLQTEIEKYKNLNDEIQGKFYDLQMKLAELEQENSQENKKQHFEI